MMENTIIPSLIWKIFIFYQYKLETSLGKRPRLLKIYETWLIIYYRLLWKRTIVKELESPCVRNTTSVTNTDLTLQSRVNRSCVVGMSGVDLIKTLMNLSVRERPTSAKTGLCRPEYQETSFLSNKLLCFAVAGRISII